MNSSDEELFCAFPVPSTPRSGLVIIDEPSELGICSPDWTRTSNRPINSRMLCQLSYGGPAVPNVGSAGPEYPTTRARRNGRGRGLPTAVSVLIKHLDHDHQPAA